MTSLPPITLTRTDAERLEELLGDAPEDSPALVLERLEEELRRARVVEAAAPGVVGLGSRVEYENLESGQRRVVELVLPRDAQPATGRLSVLTPVGCALIGLRAGDTFRWDTGTQAWRLRVVSVSPRRAA